MGKKGKKAKGQSKSALIQGKGYYFGTTIGNSFWRRYKKDNLFARGNGEIWLTRTTLYFRRYLTMNPIKIPTKAIIKITMGHGHAGKLSMAPTVKIHWLKEGETVVSGFIISKEIQELIRWQKKLQSVTKAKFL